MSQVRTIFNNMSWLMVSQIMASICGFIWTIFIARYLGVSEYGIMGFGISFSGIIGITMDFGISTHIVRHIATDYDSTPKYLGNAIPLKTLFCIGTLILTLIILIIMKADELTLTITLLFVIEGIMKSFLGLFNSSFLAFEKAKYQGIENILLNGLLFVFILLSIFTNLGIFGITFSYLIANLIALTYAYYALNKNITRPKFELDPGFCKKITLFSLPFAATGILYTIYYSIDVVMITHMVGSYATGIYNAPYKLISALTLFYGLYTGVIFPVMSKFYKNDKKLLIISYEKSVKYLMLVMIPLALAITFYSSDIIQLFYGSQYSESSSVLSILIWTVCLLFVNGAGNTLLIASHREVSVTKIYAVTAVFNVILNFILIPYLSYDGAAITTVLSDILIFIIQRYVMHKAGQKPDQRLYYDICKIITATAILGIALHFLKLNMWVALPVGIIIYIAVIYLLQIFDDDDKYVIRESLGRN